MRRRVSHKNESLKQVLINKFTSETGIHVVICEKNLLSRELEKGFYVSPNFFGGLEVDLDSALITAKDAHYLTLLGNTVVKRAISIGLCSPSSIKLIGKVRYAEVVRV